MPLVLPRRKFLLGLAAGIVAPAIVKFDSLMPVKVMEPARVDAATLVRSFSYLWQCSPAQFSVFEHRDGERVYIGSCAEDANFRPIGDIHNFQEGIRLKLSGIGEMTEIPEGFVLSGSLLLSER